MYSLLIVRHLQNLYFLLDITVLTRIHTYARISYKSIGGANWKTNLGANFVEVARLLNVVLIEMERLTNSDIHVELAEEHSQ